MSNNIEDQIVSMQFDNKQFESGVSTSLNTMDKLRNSLNFPDAGKGLQDVNTAVQRFNMNPMASAIQGVSKMWLGLTTVALTAISNITNKVVNMGLNLVKSFTLDPITQGFQEYEKNLNSVQTIMANTGASVSTTNKYLNDLNHYSDQTIYNFGQMADSIGKFTAAGVKLPAATDAIKGMANSAALAGSDANQLNTAMYQMSQALSTGVIRLMDWNSLANAGMGGANMRKSLQETARTIGMQGKIMDEAIAKHGNFRDSLQEGWLTADVFNKSMKVMAGTTNKAGKTVAYSVKQLQGMGYSLKAAKDLNKLSAAAIDSATKVKTFTQLIDVVKESIGSGWSKVFQDLFGNFKEASKLWTSVSNSITGSVSRIFGAIDKVLVGWRKMGGFEDLWTSIGNIFKILGNLLHPVIALFQALTPSTGKAGSGLAAFTSGLAKFTGFLVKLTDPIGNFSLKVGAMGEWFSFAKDMVVGFVQRLAPLLPIFDKLASKVGSLFDQGKAIAGNLIDGWLSGLDPQKLELAAIKLADSWVEWIKNALGIHSPATTMIPIGENIIMGIVEGLTKAAQLLIKAGQQVFVGLGKAFKWAVENISYDDILNTINSGLFLGIVLLFKRFVGTFSTLTDNLSEVFGKSGDVLDQFKNNLKSMQNEIRAKALMNIAIAVAVLAASAVLLASVDGKKLGISLAALGGLMITLVGAMKLLTVGGKNKDGKMPDAKTMAKQTAQIVALSGAMVAFSTAVLILAGAVAVMGHMNQKQMVQGLEGVSAVIAVIVAATAILGRTGGGATILAASAAMIVLAAALTAFVGVMKLYEKLDMKTISEGGGKAALVIGALGLAMRTFGKGAIGGSVGLVIVSGALTILVGVLEKLSKIGLGDMIKSVGALLILVDGLAAAGQEMSLAEGGAASMLVMAGAIFVLAKSLQVIAGIGLGNLAKAIGAIVISIVLMAGTAAALSELSPLVAALGTALLLLGGAIFLAGAGIFLFATAMGVLAVVGPAAFQAIADGIGTLLDVLPLIGIALGEMFVSFFTGIAQAAGPLVKAIVKLIGLLLDGLHTLFPKVRRLLLDLITLMLSVFFGEQIRFYKAVLHFVLGMIRALDEGIPKIIKAGTKLVLDLLKAIEDQLPKLIDKGAKMVIKILHGVAKAIRDNADDLHNAGKDLAGAIVEGVITGLVGADTFKKLKDAAGRIADALPGWMKKVLHINSPSKVMRDEVGRWAALGVADGLDKHAPSVEKSATDLANKGVAAMKATFKNSKKAGDGLIDITPKVTPVLDLSQLEKDATKIGSALGNHKITAETSRRTARSIASGEMNRRRHAADGNGGDTYNFEQNIYSPKPVDRVKVYRSTKSQLALHREVTGR